MPRIIMSVANSLIVLSPSPLMKKYITTMTMGASTMLEKVPMAAEGSRMMVRKSLTTREMTSLRRL